MCVCIRGVGALNYTQPRLDFVFHVSSTGREKKKDLLVQELYLFSPAVLVYKTHGVGEKDSVCVTRSRFGFHLVFFSLLHVPPALDCVVTVFFLLICILFFVFKLMDLGKCYECYETLGNKINLVSSLRKVRICILFYV